MTGNKFTKQTRAVIDNILKYKQHESINSKFQT